MTDEMAFMGWTSSSTIKATMLTELGFYPIQFNNRQNILKFATGLKNSYWTNRKLSVASKIQQISASVEGICINIL